MSDLPKVGLVLSGGGAKGAYQSGVLRALLELGTRIDVVAGASIGALNGGVLACAPTLAEGVKRLDELWMRLAQQSPLEHNMASYLKLLTVAGLNLSPFGRVLAPALRGAAPLLLKNTALLSDKPLKELMDKYLDTSALSQGLPLYVSVFKTGGGLVNGALDILRCAVSDATGLVDTQHSEFLHVQSLPPSDQKNALLASAALPFLYEARQIGDRRYSDGGQGGWKTVQGNTPIAPLIDAGCKLLIVTHLNDGSLWSRHNFPDVTILEIRPQSDIARDGLLDMLGFDESKIPRWVEQGYRDTLHCVGRVQKASQARTLLQDSQKILAEIEQTGAAEDAAMNEAMSKLR